MTLALLNLWQLSKEVRRLHTDATKYFEQGGYAWVHLAAFNFGYSLLRNTRARGHKLLVQTHVLPPSTNMMT